MLHCMGNREALRVRESGQALCTLPSAAMRGGNFSELLAKNNVIYDPTTRKTGADGKITATPFDGNIIPPSSIPSVTKKFLDFYPAPNLVNGTNLVNDFQQAQSSPRNNNFFILR